MSRIVNHKELVNTKLAANYGGWMYCTNCNKNIGYLCYVTYDQLKLNYQCNCGSKGSVLLDFEDSKIGNKIDKDLIVIKNRFCCPDDNTPLITILDKNVSSYKLEIVCHSCNKVYKRNM